MNILTKEQRDWIVATCPTPADIINAAEAAILAKLSDGFVMPAPASLALVLGTNGREYRYSPDQLRAADAGGYARGFQAGAAAQLAQEPIAWGVLRDDGTILDCINPTEHARLEGGYDVPIYTLKENT